MSGGCGRNPPPFPDNEDQEAELDTRVLDSDEDDDDEGEDIFTGARVRHLLQNEWPAFIIWLTLNLMWGNI